MNSNKLSESLAMDLGRLGMTQGDLARRLSERGEAITEPAISNWISRSRIPRSRAAHLTEIFGPDSATARWLEDEYARRWSMPAPDRMHMIFNAMQKVNEANAIVMPEALEQTVRGLIPEEFRPHLNRAPDALVAGNFKYRMDYVSPRAVVDLKVNTGPNLQPSIYRTLFQLAAIKATNKDDRVFGVIVLSTGTDYLAGTNKVVVEANALGVYFEVVDTPEKAALVLMNWENAVTVE